MMHLASAQAPSLESLLAPVRRIGDALVAFTPTLFSGLAVLIGVWLGAKLVRAVVQKMLAALRLDAAIEPTRLHSLLKAVNKDWTASSAIAQLVYLAMLLLAWNVAAGIWGLGAMQSAIGAVLGYLPKVLSALVVFAVGGYLASVAKRAVGGLLRELRNPAASILESATEAVILLVVALIAVDMLGADLSFITANLTLFVGAFLVVAVFLMCWSMRHPAEELIANYYLRRMLKVGDQVEVGELRGTVLSFVPLGLMVREPTGRERFIPAKSLIGGLTRTPAVKPTDKP